MTVIKGLSHRIWCRELRALASHAKAFLVDHYGYKPEEFQLSKTTRYLGNRLPTPRTIEAGLRLFVLFTGLETKLGPNRDLGGLIDVYLWDEDARREINEIIDRRIWALYRSRLEAQRQTHSASHAASDQAPGP